MKIRSLGRCSVLFLFTGLASLQAAAPWNDNFSKRTTLTGGLTDAIVLNGSSSGATSESGELSHSPDGSTASASVWYSWTPPAGTPLGASVTIDTLGSSFDTVLSVSTGATVNGQSDVVAPNDDVEQGVLQSSITFNVNPALTYNIAIDGYNGAAGSFKLRIAVATTRERNDNFSERTVLFGSQIKTLNLPPPRGFSLENATREINELAHSVGQVGSAPAIDTYYYYTRIGADGLPETRKNLPITTAMVSVTGWFSWQAPYDGPVKMRVATDCAATLTVYEGIRMENLVKVAGPTSWNVETAFNAVRGKVYQIVIEHYTPDQTILAEGFALASGYVAPTDYMLSISMYNAAPYVILNNPRHRQVLARQAISMTAYVVDEEDFIQKASGEPIFNDPSILPFVDRVRFYARKKSSPAGAYKLVGTDVQAPYEVTWIPTEAGDYELWAEAEDDEYGYDPSTDSVIVLATQKSQNYPLTEVEIVLGAAGQPLNVLNTTPESNTLFIQEMYNNLLGRSPTTAELTDAKARLEATPPTLTRIGLVQNLINTLASNASNGQVIRLYRGMLRRLPTYSELTTAATALQGASLNLQQLADQIAAGTEFEGLYGSLTNLQYVQAIFANLSYSYDGSSNFTSLPRAVTALQLIEPAYFGKPNLYDLGDYEEKAAAFILVNRRTPTATELSALASISDLAKNLIGSASYIERYLPDAPSYVIGTNTVYVSGVDHLVITLDASGNITPSLTDTYALWQARHGIPGPSSADSEGDGVNNITEYAFESLGFDPTVNDATLLPTGGVVGSNLVINYPLDVSKEDLVLTPEFSTDMTNWYAPGASGAPSSFAVAITGGSLTTQLRQASVSTAQAPTGFLRVRIQRYDPVTGSVGK